MPDAPGSNWPTADWTSGTSLLPCSHDRAQAAGPFDRAPFDTDEREQLLVEVRREVEPPVVAARAEQGWEGELIALQHHNGGVEPRQHRIGAPRPQFADQASLLPLLGAEPLGERLRRLVCSAEAVESWVAVP